MGKKRMAVLGSENEEQVKAKSVVKREQKKLRGGKTVKTETTQEVIVPEVTAAAPKLKKIKVRSKNYQAAKTKVNPETKYSLSDAIKLLRDISYSKTNDTVELHITLVEKGFNKNVELPHSTGRTRQVAIADETTITKIAAGKIDFDVLLASPSDMPKLVKFAKVLGPKGLMPNPKNGTVVDNPLSSKSKFESATSVELKPDKDGLAMHLVVGKLSMNNELLTQNILAVLRHLPLTSKVVLKSTMSPAIKLLLWYYVINA